VAYAFTTETKAIVDQMSEFIERADSVKAKLATELLSRIARLGKPEVHNRPQSGEEGQ
jgi:hypothetical protein